MLTDQQINDLARSVVAGDTYHGQIRVMLKDGIPIDIPVLPTLVNVECIAYLLASFAQQVQSHTPEKAATPEPFSTVIRTAILDENGTMMSLAYRDGVAAKEMAEVLKETYKRGVEQGRRERAGKQ